MFCESYFRQRQSFLLSGCDSRTVLAKGIVNNMCGSTPAKGFASFDFIRAQKSTFAPSSQGGRVFIPFNQTTVRVLTNAAVVEESCLLWSTLVYKKPATRNYSTPLCSVEI